jgi:hypothetical protein
LISNQLTKKIAINPSLIQFLVAKFESLPKDPNLKDANFVFFTKTYISKIGRSQQLIALAQQMLPILQNFKLVQQVLF